MRVIICESNFLNISTVVDDRLILSAVCIGGGLVVSRWVGNVLRNYINRQSLDHKIKEKRQLLREQLATLGKSLCDLSSEEFEELDAITAQPFDSLIAQLQNGEITAAKALLAYQRKAIAAHESTNCVTEFFMEAVQIAADLDERYSKNEEKKPPLFGLPFSVKESIFVSGHDSTRGYATDLNTTRPVDALLIAKMRKLGAIPFVQTNVPQTLLSFGCSNPIYGTTTNPCSRARSSGGSSGGEGALIGWGGSPLGFGTDVAGSIRVPAHCCGIAGIKPTSNRISPVGLNRATPGFQMLMAAVGPMAPSVSALVVACRWLLGDFEATDPYVIAMPFDDNVLNAERALTIGFYEDDGYFEPVTACKRAVLEARDALLAKGHNVVRWAPPRVPRAIQLSLAMCNMDGGRVLSDLVSRDIAEPFHGTMFAFYGWPNWLRRLLAVFCSSRVADTLTGIAQSTAELRALFSDIQQYRRVFVESWQAAGLDAVICPPQSCPALPPNLAMEVPGAFSYTMLYNLLDFPAGVVKCTTVTAEDENATKQYSVVDYWSKMVKKASTEGTVGLPIGVQCAALPLKEEICLRVMQDIEKGCASYSA